MKSKLLSLILTAAMLLPIATVSAWPFSQTPEQKITETLKATVNENKQQLFEVFHPIGTATSITIHDVTFSWKNDKNTGNEDDIVSFAVRMTIYWKGPIEKDGYTKVSSVYDCESKRWTSHEILATNGIRLPRFMK